MSDNHFCFFSTVFFRTYFFFSGSDPVSPTSGHTLVGTALIGTDGTALNGTDGTVLGRRCVFPKHPNTLITLIPQ